MTMPTLHHTITLEDTVPYETQVVILTLLSLLNDVHAALGIPPVTFADLQQRLGEIMQDMPRPGTGGG
jgi:hypothetical protein